MKHVSSRFWCVIGLLLLAAAAALLFHPLPPDPAAPATASAPASSEQPAASTAPSPPLGVEAPEPPAPVAPSDPADPFRVERSAFAARLVAIGEPDGERTVHLPGYLIDTSRTTTAGRSTREPQPAWPDAEGIYLVQCAEPLRETWRRELTALGARVYDAVPNQALLVRAGGETLARIAALPQVTWIGVYRSDYRVEPFLQHLAWAWPEPATPVQVRVRALEADDMDRIAAAISRFTGKVLARSSSQPELRAELPVGAIAPLADLDGLRWIEEHRGPER